MRARCESNDDNEKQCAIRILHLDTQSDVPENCSEVFVLLLLIWLEREGTELAVQCEDYDEVEAYRELLRRAQNWAKRERPAGLEE